jgi:hypothetical protein
MATDNDKKKDYEQSYNAGQAHWAGYWDEARKDIKHRDNDQYSEADKRYLKSQDREALVFNKAHRIVNLISGYEQKNLMALKIDPFEGADDKTASQFSGLVMHNMMYGGGYPAASGAFEFGAVIAGMNLIEPWVDRSDDLLNGDIRFRRLPYNRYVLDPNFTDKNLDIDCSFICTRDYFTKDQIIGLLPEREKDINSLKGTGGDSKYQMFYPLKGKNNEYNLKYDRFYQQVWRPYRIIADMTTGKMWPMPNKADKKIEEIIRLFMSRYDSLKIIKGVRKGVDLNIFVEGELMYSGLDPSRLDEYPFVLSAGYYTPEDDDPKYRLQGVVRCLRDPGVEVNRRRSMILDMLDGVIRQGWKAKEGKVKNEEELYSSGFRVLWMAENADMSDAEQLVSPPIPQGLFQATELFDKDHDEISGANSEMLGSPNNDDIEVAAVLSRMRAANGLTTLQGLFTGRKQTLTLLGRKQIKIIQKNFTPDKVGRILGEPPAQEFYTKDFAKYDCVPTESIITDSQRQLYYTQLIGYKKMGMPLPWSEIIDYGPLEYKDKLKETLQKAEKSQAMEAQQQQQMDMIAKALLNADRQYKIAGAAERISQAQENRSVSELDRAKTIKELHSIDLESFGKTLGLLQQMLAMMQSEQRPQQAQPQLENMPPMGGVQ